MITYDGLTLIIVIALIVIVPAGIIGFAILGILLDRLPKDFRRDFNRYQK